MLIPGVMYFSSFSQLTRSFLPLVDPSGRRGESHSVLCGKCYPQLFPRGEYHANVPRSWGQTCVLTGSNDRSVAGHSIPDNLV